MLRLVLDPDLGLPAVLRDLEATDVEDERRTMSGGAPFHASSAAWGGAARG